MPKTTIATALKTPITQELLRHYSAVERAFLQCREFLLDAATEGRPVEPGPLDVNVLAIVEPATPLVINARVAAALRQAAREANVLEVVDPAQGKEGQSE